MSGSTPIMNENWMMRGFDSLRMPLILQILTDFSYYSSLSDKSEPERLITHKAPMQPFLRSMLSSLSRFFL